MIAISGSKTILSEKLFSLLHQENEVACVEDINDIGTVSPDVFINCAEYSDLDTSEYIREHAYYCNALALNDITKICLREKILLVHISSSCIFDGKKNVPYTEDDEPLPLSVYGDSKLLGEKIISRSGCSFLNIRFSDLYGGLSGLPIDCIDKIKRGESYKVIENQYVSPVYTEDAATAVIALLKSEARGVFHFSQQGYAKAGDFFKAVLQLYNNITGENLPEVIEEIAIEEFLSPAERPIMNVLDSAKFCDVTGRMPRHWSEALQAYLEGEYNLLRTD